MGRELTSHKMAGLNDQLLVHVLDQPGQGNACHEYQIRRWVTGTGDKNDDIELCHIKFQDGPIGEFGVNGISNESLLAVVEDRLIGFQSGPYACAENTIALENVRAAIAWLQKRTRDRLARGVEGTSQQ